MFAVQMTDERAILILLEFIDILIFKLPNHKSFTLIAIKGNSLLLFL